MSSSPIDILPTEISESEPSFDTYEIDYKIFKDGEFSDKSDKKTSNNKFKLLPGLTQEEIQEKDEKEEYIKYFCTINTKNFDYIGILTNKLKRDKYGYSKMDNGDEYLGEFKNEIRDGFGIYKFNPSSDGELSEIYIGEYKDGKKQGQGIYLKIYKSIKEDSTNDLILINYNSGIGIFEEDELKSGKIFTLKDGISMLYQGKLNQLGEPEDDDALMLEEGNKIFKGKISKGNMIEGRNIIVNDKYRKIKAYYFNKKENNEFDFDYNKNEEIDNDCIKIMKEGGVKFYEKEIQNIFKMVNNSFNKFKEFETAINIDFDNDIKNKIKSEVDKIIKQ